MGNSKDELIKICKMLIRQYARETDDHLVIPQDISQAELEKIIGLIQTATDFDTYTSLVFREQKKSRREKWNQLVKESVVIQVEKIVSEDQG